MGFREVELLTRDGTSETLPLDAVPTVVEDGHDVLDRLSTPRLAICGVELDRPRLMGVLNVTPDSFSDGGSFADAAAAVAHGIAMVQAGADIIDIGGESTRPGAEPIDPATERDRVLPVIDGLRKSGCDVPLSIDTRNASVARAALDAGATIFNDVSALRHDPDSIEVGADAGAVCLMHAQGEPQTMQRAPNYEAVLFDVFDSLSERLAAAMAAGIPRSRIIIDPGIGFGKTMAHNLTLLRRVSLFHELGCALMLGVSRKRFIGTLGGAPKASDRAPGSIAAGLAGLAEGVQILRVHDVAETAQAVAVWQAVRGQHEEAGA